MFQYTSFHAVIDDFDDCVTFVSSREIEGMQAPTSGRMAGNKFMEYVDARKGENYEELARGNDILGYSERSENKSGGNTVLWGVKVTCKRWYDLTTPSRMKYI